MDAIELQYIQLAKQINTVAMQAALAYDQAQKALQLGELMSTQRLSTAEGTRQSLETLDQLAVLHQSHKEMFAKFMTAAMAQLTAVIAQMPEAKAHAYEAGIVESLNQQLARQANFYVNREKWIAAVRDMYLLVDGQRDDIELDDGQLVFYHTESADRFNQLLQTIDHIHHLEVADMNERMQRIAATNAWLEKMDREPKQ